MIEVYAFSTPNSVRVPIALEELGLDYELKSVNVKKAEQKSPDLLALIRMVRFQCSSILTARRGSRLR